MSNENETVVIPEVPASPIDPAPPVEVVESKPTAPPVADHQILHHKSSDGGANFQIIPHKQPKDADK